MELITWLSKKQPTIKSYVSKAYFEATNTVMKELRGLIYKLQIMDVPLTGLSYSYGYNMYVIHNTQRPGSTLKNKNNAVCYHLMRDSVSMVESLTSHIPNIYNLSDMLTKTLFGQKKVGMVEEVLYNVFGLFLYPICCHLDSK